MATEHNSTTSYEVKIGGKTLNQPTNDGVESLVIEDHVDMVESMTLKLGGAEQQPTWDFKIGDTVEVKMGTGSCTLFKGEVVAVEPSWTQDGLATYTIRALDQAQRLARGRKTRFFENKKDSEIAQTVGSDAQMSVEADETTEVHPYTLQRNESNLTFLKRLAARNNFQVTVDEGKLLFKRANTQSGATNIKMGENLRSVKMAFNSMDQVKEVIVRGWDIREKKEIVGKASAGNIEKIGGGSDGSSLSSGLFGDSTAYITDVPVSSQAQADEVAKSEMNRLARQFAKGSCTVEGNDALRAGTTVKMDGLSSQHNGTYYIISSRHMVTPDSGYITEITFCSNTYGS
jgi:phage protein D